MPSSTEILRGRLSFTSTRSPGTDNGFFPSATMASESRRNIRRESLGCLNVFTPATNTPAQALAWQSANGSWTSIMDASGSSPRWGKDRPFGSRSQSEEPAGEGPARILIVDDNPADVLLIKEAIQGSGVDAVDHVVH